MLFIVMHKVDAKMEAGALPDQALVSAMGKLVGDTVRAGKLHLGAGLRRSATRVRLNCADGACTTTPGPLVGNNELVAGLVMISVKSMDEAITWSRRLAGDTGDVEIEVGPVTEPWDIGPPPEATARWDEAVAAMAEAGVLLAAERLAPSASGVRLRGPPRRSVTDGPYTESKELVAGFAIIDADSRDDAVAWAVRYADILGDVEVDVRPVIPKGAPPAAR
jgi:hypothetical protein